MSVRADILIPGRARAVWDVLTDLPSYPAWNPFLRRVEGDLREGARWRVRLTLDGHACFTVPTRITRCVPGESLAWRGGLPGLMTGLHGFTLSETPEGVSFEQREDFSGPLVPAVLPMLRAPLRRRFVEMNEALRAEVARRAGP